MTSASAIGTGQVPLAKDGHGRVAYLAVKVPETPPVALVVEHFKELARFNGKLFVVVGLSIVGHFVDSD